MPRRGVSTTLMLSLGAERVRIRLLAAKGLVADLAEAADALMVSSGTVVVPLGVDREQGVRQVALLTAVQGELISILGTPVSGG